MRNLPGTNPIEEARNLGPASGLLLREVGISTLEELQSTGWQDALEKACRRFPEAMNLNFATALIGAEIDCDWRRVPSALKSEAKRILNEFKREARV